jgi:ABC-type polysaccharide/polyol phosphate export permease
MSELTIDALSRGATEPSYEPSVNRPTRSRVRLTEMWTTLRVARMIAIRDIKTKYKQAALGPLWLLIAPLGMLVSITIAFSGVTDVDTGGIPYLDFALVGLTVWTYIQISATLGAQSIVGNSSLVRRSPMPRMALVTGSVLGNLPPVAVMFTLTIVATAITQGFPVQVVLLPLLVVWLFVFTIGLAMLLGALTVRFRDTSSALPLIIQAGIFVSPVGYPLQGAPANIHVLLALNPVSGLIEAWRWAILDLPNPQWLVIAIAGVWTVAIVGFGWRVFGRLEVKFADYV